MKKLLSVLPSTLQGGFRGGLLFLALLTTTTLWAYDFQSGDLYYNITSDTTVEVTSSVDNTWGGGNYPNLITASIPETVTYNGSAYSVTGIGEWAFSYCSQLTAITIPENITSLGYGIFAECTSLTSIQWNATNVNSFFCGDGPFDGLNREQITSFVFGENVKHIPSCICLGMTNLTSIIIPNSVTSIGEWAFKETGVYNDEVNWENGVLYIDNCLISAKESISGNCVIKDGTRLMANNAFRNCKSLTSVTIPNSVTSIEDYVFADCSSLTSITIPESVTSIGDYAFAFCSSLTSITIPESVTSIGNSAFSGCSGLTSVTIGNNVTSIGDYAFCNCYSLTSVTIGNSVTSIGYEAFYGCKSLTSITIPESVSNIESYAFNHCSALTKTNYTGDIAGWCDIKFGSSNSNPIFYSHNLYIKDQEIKDLVIPNTVNTIRNYAFYNGSSLTSITIPNSVTSIGSCAFRNCQSLTSITIPNSVTSIEDYVFADCSSLTSITIPNSVTSIGNSAFRNCQSLTSITIPNSVTSIEARAFGGCSSLTSITCEATTPPTLGNNTFYQVSTSIPVYVPCGCVSAYKAASTWKDFTKIQEPQAEYSIQVSTSNSQMGTAKVDYNTFCDGSQITATANYGYHFTQWSDGVTDNPRTLTLTQDTVLSAEFALTTAGQCGKNLYWVYDTNKSTLTITGSGDMYNERPWGLFTNDLTEVVLPEGLTYIGNDAFVDCINLKAITIPASVTSIGANSFAGCRRIRDVYCYPLMPPYAEAASFENYNANLNVPCDFLEDYQYDPVFGSFKYFNCMGAESDNTGSDEVVVTPGTTDVTIVWPTEEDADTYSIVIYKDGRVFCTLTFNANGQLLNIAFAPGRDGNRTVQYAEQVANGYRFTVTGLTESTKYEYNITTKDELDNTISTHTGEFTTKSNTPTDLENNDIQYPISDTRKLLRDGQLYIYHNGSAYTIMGQKVSENF